MKVNITAPKISVQFTTVDGDQFTATSIEFGGDITSMTTQKALGANVAGSFSFEMVARGDIVNFYKGFTGSFSSDKAGAKNAYGVFRPAGLVDIYINDEEVMIGIIDSVVKNFSASSGKPVRTFTVTGRDLGAFLIDHKVWWDQSTAGLQRVQIGSVMSGAYYFGMIGSQPPHKIMEQIIVNWFIKTMTRIVPGKDNAFRFSGDVDNEIWDRFITLGEDTPSREIWDTKVTETPPGSGTYVETPQSLLGTAVGPGALSKTTFGNFFPMSFSPWDFQGDLWSFIRPFCSTPFNELFVDTGGSNMVVPLGAPRKNMGGNNWDFTTTMRDLSGDVGAEVPVEPNVRNQKLMKGRAYLIFRPTPFDDNTLGIEPTDMISLLTMQDLPAHHITDEDVVQKRLELNREGMPSLYFCLPSNNVVESSAARYVIQPEYDWKALSRYGYNPMEVQLEAFDLFTKNFGNGDVIQICQQFQKKLKSWYSRSDKMLQGSFTIRGHEKIRIGQALYYDRMEDGVIEDEYEEGYFYIVGVSHSYQYGKIFSTTVQVDRGVSKKITGAIYDSALFLNPKIRG